MTTLAQQTAKPPVSPHANLTATERTGTTGFGSAIWQVSCTCGITLTANAPAIKRGAAHCPTCNPRHGPAQARKILAALPGTHAKIERKTKLTRPQIEYRLDWMRERGMCHIGDWERAEQQGSFGPVFHAGAGEDAPCTLKRRSDSSVERKYRKRVRKAIEAAEAGDKVDGRYLRRVSLHIAAKTARKTRTEPQGWAAALFVGVKVDREQKAGA